ncbi:MAG: PfkB family carbohydrate kinase, partial [Pseudomonadota bacterium]
EVIVKHGAKGALVGSGRWIAPRKVVKPHDTTGAGDSFNAAYLSARLNKACPEEAALAGHDLASRVLMVPGAIMSVS